TGPSTPAIMLKQVTEPALPVRQRRREVPEDLERIVMRLLEKDPANRFADGAALVAALDGAPVSAVGSSTVARGVPPATATKVRQSLAWYRGSRAERHARREEQRRGAEEAEEARPLPVRIRKFRRHFARYIGTTLLLFGI